METHHREEYYFLKGIMAHGGVVASASDSTVIFIAGTLLQDGTTRDIKIGCIRDRVVQQSCYALLAPLFEPRFSQFSFAFRPGRNAHQSVEYVTSLIKSGKK